MKPANKLPTPPSHLSKESKSYFGKIVADYDLTDSEIIILERICSALDRETQAREGLKRHGSLTTTDRWGGEKPHPLVSIERAARTSVLAGIKALGIDKEPPSDLDRYSHKVF
jgi:phage terminase small subunit